MSSFADLVIVDVDNLWVLRLTPMIKSGGRKSWNLQLHSCYFLCFITLATLCGLSPVPFILKELFPSTVQRRHSITVFLRSITVFLIQNFPSLLWLCGDWRVIPLCSLVCGFIIGCLPLCARKPEEWTWSSLKQYKRSPGCCCCWLRVPGHG